jgi:Ca-activated chloride channel family protein
MSSKWWPIQRFILLFCAAQLLMGFDPFRTENDNVETGNGLLASGKLKQALERYNSAAKELPDSAGVQYNRGVALFRLGRYDEARQALARASVGAKHGTSLKARSFFNLGNAHYMLKQYKEAALGYKRALQQQPQHRAAKWNLELALRKIEEQKKKNKKKDKKNDKKNKDKKNDKKKQKKDQQKQNDKNQKQNQQKQQNKSDQKQDKQQKQQGKSDQKKSGSGKKGGKSKPQKSERPTQKQLQRKRMNQVLDALDRDDKNLQKRRLMRRGGGYRKPTKDW